jgi:aryl-alcohol dehydrogenase-like predicted oxidoreductase
MYYNEELVGKAIKKFGREKFVIATKTGVGVENGKGITSGKPEFIRNQLAQSLERLGTDYIDLYYLHRIDPDTPLEETMNCLKQFVQEGKIRYIGLSECTPAELKRAHAVHPITAIQMEWSLQSRDIEELVVPAARELGVAIVAYSPLGRGFLADIAALDSLSETDWRKQCPRFSGENYEENKRRAAKFFEIAKRKGCTPAQLALAWVHSKGEDVFPIPGTKSAKRLEENAHAFTFLPLTADEQAEIEASISVVGGRYPESLASRTYDNRL